MDPAWLAWEDSSTEIRDQAASSFRPRMEAYENALDRLIEARKHRDDALVTKLKAEGRLRSVYANVARIQEGYFRLAGLGELADRIRLTIPQTSKKEETESMSGSGMSGSAGSGTSEPTA